MNFETRAIASERQPMKRRRALAKETNMNSLRYTNAMLTIIALAFSVIAVENFIRPTVAQPTTQVQPVAICDITGKYCLDVERNFQGSFLNVRVIRQ